MDIREARGGLAPKKWGPGVWKWLHALPEHAESVERIRRCLGGLCLPCPDCQGHYDDFVKRRPIGAQIRTRSDAFQWILDLHNEINLRTNKPTFTEQQCFTEHCSQKTEGTEATGQFILGEVFL